MAETMGLCEECGEPAAVVMNGRGLCIEHFDQALVTVAAMRDQLLEIFSKMDTATEKVRLSVEVCGVKMAVASDELELDDGSE